MSAARLPRLRRVAVLDQAAVAVAEEVRLAVPVVGRLAFGGCLDQAHQACLASAYS